MITSEAFPACSCVRMVSPYLSLGVGFEVMVTPGFAAMYSLASVSYGLSRLLEVANVKVNDSASPPESPDPEPEHPARTRAAVTGRARRPAMRVTRCGAMGQPF